MGFVEYKSRSSGLWILARVEGYSASSNMYRLDVQPHARPDRIRQRQSIEIPQERDACQELQQVVDDDACGTAQHGAASASVQATAVPTNVLNSRTTHAEQAGHTADHEALKAEITRLRQENEGLQERLQEVRYLKDRYHAQLRI